MVTWSKTTPRVLGGKAVVVVEAKTRWENSPEEAIYFDVSRDEDRQYYIGFYLSLDDIREILKAVEDA